MGIYTDIATRTGGDIYIGEGVIIGLNQKALKTGLNDLVQFFMP